MTRFAEHVEDYLRLRRAFGYKLVEHARLLPRFAASLEAAGAEVVTIELALAWSTERDLAPGSGRCFATARCATPSTPR